MSRSAGDPVEALAAVYGRVDALTERLRDADFDRRTGCAAFTVADLLFHLLLDAQRALVALADPRDPAASPPDTDAVTYWQGYAAEVDADTDAPRHALFVRRSALAYDGPAGLARHWRDVSHAAVAAARRADRRAVAATQGHLLTVADLVDTLVVEGTVHLLDLVADLPAGAVAEPLLPSPALEVTRATLEGLAGAPLPDWAGEDLVRRTTGRVPPDASWTSELGDLADRLPLIR